MTGSVPFFARASLVALFALCAASTFLLRSRADRLRAAPIESRFDIPAFPAEVARPFSFGLRSAVADLMFLQAIQIHGSQRKPRSAEAGGPDDRAMNRLLTYATDLDPKFAGAYRFAGNAMPRHTTDWKVTNVLQAETLLERGVRERPDDWRIPFALGVIESYYLGKFDAAAHNFALAAKVPGSPAYVALLATRAAAEGGDLDFGEKLARAMAEQASEESSKQEWERRLVDLHMEQDLRNIEAAAQRFQARNGRLPQNLHELVRSGELRRVPREPHGGTYELDAGGHARSTVAQRLRISGRRGTTAGLEVVR